MRTVPSRPAVKVWPSSPSAKYKDHKKDKEDKKEWERPEPVMFGSPIIPV